jgi:cytochrome c oxidase subunit IV
MTDDCVSGLMDLAWGKRIMSYATTQKPLLNAVAVVLRQSSNTSMLQQMPTDFGDRTSTERN